MGGQGGIQLMNIQTQFREYIMFVSWGLPVVKNDWD